MADDKKKKPAGAKKSAAKSTSKRATTRKAPAKPAARKASVRKASNRKPSIRKAGTAKKPAAAATGARRAATASGTASRAAKSARTSNDSTTRATSSAGSAAATARVEGFGNAIDISNLAEKLWRGLSMIVFGIVGSWAYVALMILASVQYIVVLFTDKPSKELGNYTAMCRTYLSQVLGLLAYETEVLPWPLGPLPGKGN